MVCACSAIVSYFAAQEYFLISAFSFPELLQPLLQLLTLSFRGVVSSVAVDLHSLLSHQ